VVSAAYKYLEIVEARSEYAAKNVMRRCLEVLSWDEHTATKLICEKLVCISEMTF